MDHCSYWEAFVLGGLVPICGQAVLLMLCCRIESLIAVLEERTEGEPLTPQTEGRGSDWALLPLSSGL